jgi:transcriptional regulator with XRE-family HTH domain
VIPEEHTGFNQRLAYQLGFIRSNRGITQRQAAQHLKCAETKVTYLESGRLRVNVYDLVSLCQLYNVGVESILKAAEHPAMEKN